MKAYKKTWRLIDDPICDLEEWSGVPTDCADCECFFECYEEDDEENEEYENI